MTFLQFGKDKQEGKKKGAGPIATTEAIALSPCDLQQRFQRTGYSRQDRSNLCVLLQVVTSLNGSAELTLVVLWLIRVLDLAEVQAN